MAPIGLSQEIQETRDPIVLQVQGAAEQRSRWQRLPGPVRLAGYAAVGLTCAVLASDLIGGCNPLGVVPHETASADVDAFLESVQAVHENILIDGHGKAQAEIDKCLSSGIPLIGGWICDATKHSSVTPRQVDIQLLLNDQDLKKLPDTSSDVSTNTWNFAVDTKGLSTQIAGEKPAHNSDGTLAAKSHDAFPAATWDVFFGNDDAARSEEAGYVAVTAFQHLCGESLVGDLPAAIKDVIQVEAASFGDPAPAHINLTFESDGKVVPIAQLAKFLPPNFVPPMPNSKTVGKALGVSPADIKVTEATNGCLYTGAAVRDDMKLLQASESNNGS